MKQQKLGDFNLSIGHRGMIVVEVGKGICKHCVSRELVVIIIIDDVIISISPISTTRMILF